MSLDRAENDERAIACLEAALTVRTPEADPHDWARIRVNLDNAHARRVRGDRAENQEEATATTHTVAARMTDTSDGKRDFFISFNKADRVWATWIAWVLEEAGHSAWFQDWDFRGNFVLEMDKAHKLSRRTIAVLSPDYLASRFTAPEWAARFQEDANSEHDLLISVRVREGEVQGLLRTIVYTDLLGITQDEARQRLLDRVAGIRLKPKEEPSFPGSPLPTEVRSVPVEPRFPLATHNLLPSNPDFTAARTRSIGCTSPL